MMRVNLEALGAATLLDLVRDWDQLSPAVREMRAERISHKAKLAPFASKRLAMACGAFVHAWDADKVGVDKLGFLIGQLRAACEEILAAA